MTTLNESQIILADNMRESELSQNIVDLAPVLGWLVHRDPIFRATAAYPGYPDLTLVHETGLVIWIECKSTRGKLSSSQQMWRERLSKVGGNTRYEVWTPVQWFDGTIEAALGVGINAR